MAMLASRVNDESKRPIIVLRKVPSGCWCDEVSCMELESIEFKFKKSFNSAD